MTKLAKTIILLIILLLFSFVDIFYFRSASEWDKTDNPEGYIGKYCPIKI